jgi:hypothetical protein
MNSWISSNPSGGPSARESSSQGASSSASLLRAAGALDAYLEAAVARPQRPGRSPAAFVEPGEHFAADRRKLAFVVELRGLVVALRPRLQLRDRRLGGKPRFFASALDRGENVGACEFDQTRRHRYVLPGTDEALGAFERDG